MTTLSSREVNHDLGRAKKATANGPVIITDRGKAAFVLLSIDEFRRMTSSSESVIDALASDDNVDLDAYLPKRHLPSSHRDVDLT